MDKESAKTKIVNIYVLLLSVGFPLIMTDKYYNIGDDKMYFYLYTTIACMILTAIAAVYDMAAEAKAKKSKSGKKGGKKKKSGIKDFFRGLELNSSEIFAICLLISIIISTVCSEWVYEAFWGNKGRYNGLFMWIFYIAGFLLISRYCKPKRWHIIGFAAAGLIVCLWCVLDFYCMSPMGWQAEHFDYKAFDFSSTFGNINFLTAYEGMVLLFVSALFIGNDRPRELKEQAKASSGQYAVACAESALYAAASFTAFMSLACGLSDNAIISAAAAICFLPFYAFRSPRSLLKYIGLLAGWVFSLALIGLIVSAGAQTVTRPHWGGLVTLAIDHTGLMLACFAACAVIFIIAAVLLHKNAGNISDAALAKTLRTIWAILGVIAACILIYIFYDANHGGEWEIYSKYSTIFIFNDEWGTHRGFNWSLALSYFKEFPLFKKLFGSGPETYFIYTFSFDRIAMQNTFHEAYDSPHNEMLQNLVTLGIAGFAAYYGWAVTAMVNGFKTVAPELTSALRAGAYGCLAYVLVSFVNVSSPINFPVFVLCLGLACAGHRGSKMKLETS